MLFVFEKTGFQGVSNACIIQQTILGQDLCVAIIQTIFKQMDQLRYYQLFLIA